MDSTPPKKEGVRERKRRETLRRIAETALGLFIENGYEPTTLEAIAKASGISARTFFYYFESKEEILLASQATGFLEALRPGVRAEFRAKTPLEAARRCLLKLVSRYENDQSIVIDRLMQSTEALRARKQAIFVEMEEALFAGLCELWPQPRRRPELRTVAMISIGCMRLAMETWRRDNGARPLTKVLRERFAIVQNKI